MRRPPSRRLRATVSMTMGDFGQGLFHGGGDLRIFVIDDARDFQGGFGVESLRRLIHAFGDEVVQGRMFRRTTSILNAGFGLRHSGHDLSKLLYTCAASFYRWKESFDYDKTLVHGLNCREEGIVK